MGSADEEIASDRGSLPWSCNASSLTILPFLTVARTWALPYCVGTASPVAVRDPVEVLFGELAAVGGAVAVARFTAGACGWKARTPAVPAMVAARTMGERRMVRTRR